MAARYGVNGPIARPPEGAPGAKGAVLIDAMGARLRF